MRSAWARVAAAAAWLASAAAAQAVTVAAASPQGEVAQVRQVVLRFSGSVVPLGDLRQADPARLNCLPATPPGSGRWLSDREWVFDFRAPVPPGRRCTVALRADWRPPLAGAGAVVGGRTEFRFATGGPAVVQVQPWPGSEVEEDAHFLVQLSGPAVESDLPARAGCEIEGLGDRLPVRVVGGAPRDALLKWRRITDAALAARTVVLTCSRPLPTGAKLRLVWGEGIASRDDPAVVTRSAQRFDYTVRPAFAAEFSCERERANAPCVPVRPLTLTFSAPVARAQAAAVRLQAPDGKLLAPAFDKDDKDEELSSLRFAPPFLEGATYRIVLPPGLQDRSGRALANAASYPLAVATGEAPPIAKFAAAPFGVIERFAEGDDGAAVLPLTLRHVQGDLRPAAAGGQVRVRRLQTDAEVLAWYRKLQRWHESALPARELGYPADQWTVLEEDTDAQGRKVLRKVERRVATREVSLLAADPQATRLALPGLEGGDPRPFEVIGIPLAGPGYHVVEIESQRLGAALLDKHAPMYVRTGVLVTNLGVHFKHGRESSVVWVTSLDRGRPVAGAEVVVHDCSGKPLWNGRTGDDGLARIAAALDRGRCRDGEGLFVSARKPDAEGGATDLAFVFSDWQRGIEPWRFNVPTSMDPEPDRRAHTVFDRTLLRAGETVSMKHFVRRETAGGLALLDEAQRPDRVKIVHQGSGDEVTLPLAWAGVRSAVSSWRIPTGARLGSYRVLLERSPAGPADAGGQRARTEWPSGEFRVEAFRVPLLDARVDGPPGPLVAPAELPVDVQLNYQSGGAVAAAPLTLTALLQPRGVAFAGFEDYSFQPPRQPGQGEDEEAAASEAGDDARAMGRTGRLVADRLPATTSRAGGARFVLAALPKIERASEIVAEVGFTDPSGEVQTVATTLQLWPSAVVPGLRAAPWARRGEALPLSVVALDTAGKPLAGRIVEVHARLRQVFSTRKRIVGGFYAYDNRVELRELGRVCAGRTDARGQLGCAPKLDAAGEVELVASAADDAGRVAAAAASVWSTAEGEQWFAQGDDDRIDVLPVSRRVEPGATARLQVRSPYRSATALVAVEREGVIDTRVVTLRGSEPTVELKVDPAWAPNVYVSVLVLRGRIREVPWYSIFTWGWREPIEWARSFWFQGREFRPPTALVDLARPSFRLGVAALEVGSAAHRLDVAVTPDKAQYAVREQAKVRVRVTQGGRPVAGAELAFAAVDEGLLALRENSSWDLLAGLLRPRPWGVETSTAQGEIVGRRHYGRKAVAAGGGGGRGGTRELFQTLLVWLPRVALDAQGEATVEVPLNDSLTSFRLVAVADDGAQRFGTGSASVRVTQDLQLLSGLPPLVREGDRFDALLTLRNTTARPMTVRATLRGSATADGQATTAIELAPQQATLAPGAAAELSWPVDVPAAAERIAWQATADETGGAAAKDRVRITQAVAAAVPLRVLQATLVPVAPRVSLPLAAPAAALRTGAALRGGLVVGLQPRLGAALPGLRRFFERYPFVCLEQQVSKAIGLRDTALFARVAEALPAYLDADGLASYYPPAAGAGARGSDRLTAYLLAAAHEAGYDWPEPVRERMLQGLAAFAEGRIERRFWSPRADLDVRRIAAIEALARHGRASARLLGAVQLAPNLWPTAAVIDWLSILRRVEGIPGHASRLREAQQVLRSRLSFAGTTLRFSTEDEDFWWWLMDSADANAARLILAVMDDPAWRAELPRLVAGHLARQRRGAWLTTTANLWSALALERFGERFESVPVSGRTTANTEPGLPSAARAVDWAATPAGGTLRLPWPEPAGTLEVVHEGGGRPWLTVQALAAVPLAAPLAAGYTVARSTTAVTRRDPQRWSRGDVVRVRLEIDAAADRTWVVVADPVPAGAAILGSGLGRDSAIAVRSGERDEQGWRPAFEERGFEQYRATFEFLPRGHHVVEYTLRLNNAGRFTLPPTRVEAMYAPETFGEAPNPPGEVAP